MMISVIFAAMLVFSGVLTTGTSASAAGQKITPQHQVVAMYFHRTERCPTCKRIGAMAEEAVTNGFALDAKAGTVEFRFVDFQDKKNSQLTHAYGIKAPTLVLLSVFEGETVCWTDMPRVWQLVGKPDEFRAYVCAGMVRYLQQSREVAEQEREKSKESK